MNTVNYILLAVLLVILGIIIGKLIEKYSGGRSAIEVLTGKKNRSQRDKAGKSSKSLGEEHNSSRDDVLSCISSLTSFARRNHFVLLYPGTLKKGNVQATLLGVLVMRSGIVGINIFGFGGTVRGSSSEGAWTQTLNGRTQPIPNPLERCREQEAALRAILHSEGLPVSLVADAAASAGGSAGAASSDGVSTGAASSDGGSAGAASSDGVSSAAASSDGTEGGTTPSSSTSTSADNIRVTVLPLFTSSHVTLLGPAAKKAYTRSQLIELLRTDEYMRDRGVDPAAVSAQLKPLIQAGNSKRR